MAPGMYALFAFPLRSLRLCVRKMVFSSKEQSSQSIDNVHFQLNFALKQTKLLKLNNPVFVKNCERVN